MREEANLTKLMELALAEDVGPGDFTTEWTVPQEAEGEAVIVAKEDLIVSGAWVAMKVFHRVETRLRVTQSAGEGDRVTFGDEVLRIKGPLRGILTGERVAMNFLGHLSGIATLTRRFVDAVQGTGAVILDTRKTTPGWRLLEKGAVSAGGGGNHRMGLHDMILVKDNHLAAAGGIRESVARVRERNQAGLAVEVEVKTMEELDEALPLGLDRILLDNMSLEVLGEAVRRIRCLGDHRPLAEASGNMNLETVRAVAELGVDLISVGALTHSAPAADLSLKVI